MQALRQEAQKELVTRPRSTRDEDASDGTRTKKCGCRIDIETGDTIEMCSGHEDADGYDDEQPLFDPDEAGR